MKTRWIVLGIVLVVILVLGISYAFAATPTWPSTTPSPEQVHNSAGMPQMHAQMPAQTQTQCDAMRAQMSSMMGATRAP